VDEFQQFARHLPESDGPDVLLLGITHQRVPCGKLLVERGIVCQQLDDVKRRSHERA